MAVKFWLHVKTLAKREQVSRLANGEYRASVHAPAQDGKANDSLIQLLARHFSVPRSKVKILRGRLSHKKLIEIE